MNWKRNIPSQPGWPSSINVVDTITIGPNQQVQQTFESPLEALNLTLPDACIDTVVRYTNQKYEQYCREHPRGSLAHRFRGYRSFSKEKVLAFMAYHLSLELIKLPKTQYLTFTTLSSYRISKLHCLVIGCYCWQNFDNLMTWIQGWSKGWSIWTHTWSLGHFQ